MLAGVSFNRSEPNMTSGVGALKIAKRCVLSVVATS